MTTPSPKTPAEIAALKEGWQDDPCWDIESTEGFEAHRDELLAFSNACKKKWSDEQNAKKEKEQKRLTETSEQLGLAGLLAKIEHLQSQLDRANEKIWHLENPHG